LFPVETTIRKGLNKKNDIFFLFYKIRKQEGWTGPVWGFGTSGRVEEVGKGYGRANIM
jgi:hypothetical protein